MYLPGKHNGAGVSRSKPTHDVSGVAKWASPAEGWGGVGEGRKLINSTITLLIIMIINYYYYYILSLLE